MCGIIAYSGPKDGTGIVVDGLKRLEYRGYDSWGVACRNGDSILLHKSAGKIGQVDRDRDMADLTGTPSIGHVRWATHGAVSDANAHPHLSPDGRIALVHNGIVENFQELRRERAELGVEFASDTDTEVIAHVVAEELKSGKDILEAVRGALAKLEGSYAVAILDRQTGTLIGARKWSPLVVGVGDGEHFIASDAPAFLAHTRDVIFLDDFQMVRIDDDGNGGRSLSIHSVESGEEVEPEVQRIEWSLEQAERGGYPHFTIKEINEQPEVIDRVLATDDEELEAAAKLIREARRVHLVACGTALHAGMYASYLLASRAGMDARPISAGEFPYLASMVQPGDLVLSISQSGETADVLASVREAKARGAKVLSVVNVLGSSLMRESDVSILSKAGPEISVVSTKAYASQLSVLTLLSAAVAGDIPSARASLAKARDDISQILSSGIEEKLEEIARILTTAPCIYSIGRRVDYASALEWCLKIKEIAYLHGEGFAAGDLKHGPLALIEEGIPVFVIASDEAVFPETLSNAIEAKSRGALIIAVATEDNDVFDYHLPVEPNGPQGAISAIVY
ncbi:MAG: glutamine--fructose-6-phosphate transaminase (isomerizing), partial [Armatimonadia bacterium]|nr:glutamine--fructose-6-phosphate transaminase (isomerizing) [Armatimonadia bacterium]